MRNKLLSEPPTFMCISTSIAIARCQRHEATVHVTVIFGERHTYTGSFETSMMPMRTRIIRPRQHSVWFKQEITRTCTRKAKLAPLPATITQMHHMTERTMMILLLHAFTRVRLLGHPNLYAVFCKFGWIYATTVSVLPRCTVLKSQARVLR